MKYAASDATAIVIQIRSGFDNVDRNVIRSSKLVGGRLYAPALAFQSRISAHRGDASHYG